MINDVHIRVLIEYSVRYAKIKIENETNITKIIVCFISFVLFRNSIFDNYSKEKFTVEKIQR
jgi:hypothetical protein